MGLGKPIHGFVMEVPAVGLRLVCLYLGQLELVHHASSEDLGFRRYVSEIRLPCATRRAEWEFSRTVAREGASCWMQAACFGKIRQ